MDLNITNIKKEILEETDSENLLKIISEEARDVSPEIYEVAETEFNRLLRGLNNDEASQLAVDLRDMEKEKSTKIQKHKTALAADLRNAQAAAMRSEERSQNRMKRIEEIQKEIDETKEEINKIKDTVKLNDARLVEAQREAAEAQDEVARLNQQTQNCFFCHLCKRIAFPEHICQFR